jgi:glycosyltransferase involved in cell wall biosynthesis
VVFADEAAAALAALDPAPDLVFSHTTGDFELLAWQSVAARRTVPLRCLALLLRNTPGYVRCGRLRRLFHPYWRLRPQTLRGIRRILGDRFVLATDSDLVTRDYQSIFDGRMMTLPIPVDPRLEVAPPPSATAEAIRFLYVGEARGGKGFDVLCATVLLALRSTTQARFTVQVAAPPGSHPQGDVASLRAAAAERPDRVTIAEGPLSMDHYVGLLRDSDVVVLPYTASGYREATSGVFAEAVAAGRPVLAARNTWMSHELARGHGAGLIVEDLTPSGLLTAVEAAIGQWGELRKRALAVRGEWAAHHNADNLVRVLLEAAR